VDIAQAADVLGGHFGFVAGDENKLIHSLGLPSGAYVLDVGTGMGHSAILLALNGYRVLTGEPESDESIYARQDWLGNVQKVGVDHLISFRPFSADAMPFDDDTFDAAFFLGVLHHVDEEIRAKVLAESVRACKPNAPVCLLEPNDKTLRRVKEQDPSHPDAADPSEYAGGLGLSLEKQHLQFFDAFVFRRSPA